MRFFQKDPIAEAERERRKAAYEQGRKDGHNDVDDSGLMTEHGSAVRRAYDRGRRDERARRPRRRGTPVLTTVLLLAACAGAFVVYLGVSQGSFAGGGRTIDQNIANAKAHAAQASRTAADRAGDALENAGQRIKQQNGDS